MIPPSVQRELDEAEQRTGWTQALDTAALALWFIFEMTPEEFEECSSGIYDNLT